MRDFTELWPGGPFFAQAEHFKLGTDSVLLADFINCASARRGIDLGCASGAIGLLLLVKSEKLHMTGLELLPDAAELAGRNMARNALEGRSEIICGDIREHRSLFPSGSFDLVSVNPPYFPEGRGLVSPVEGRASARSETQCSLEDICTAAEWLLKTGGGFFMVHKPERLCEIFLAMSRHHIEPKRLRLVCHRADKAPSLVLIEGRRGGKSGLKHEPILILNESDGSESAEYRRIYHR